MVQGWSPGRRERSRGEERVIYASCLLLQPTSHPDLMCKPLSVSKPPPAPCPSTVLSVNTDKVPRKVEKPHLELDAAARPTITTQTHRH